MLRPFFAAMFCCIMIVSASSGQTPIDKKPNAEARFHDGTSLRNVQICQTVELATEKGTVQVHAEDVVRIEIGMRLTKDETDAIAKSIRNLGDNNYALREAATKHLLRMGHRAYPALRRAATSKDAEVSKRALATADKVRELASAESLALGDCDVIYTRDRRLLRGVVEGSTIKIQSAVAGAISINTNELLSIVDRSGEFSVRAQRFSDGIQWLDTGVDIESGKSFAIRASGSIVHAGTFGIQLLTKPDGNFGLQFGTIYNRENDFWAGGRTHPPGTLVGKFGDKGEHFVIGSSFEGTVEAQGRLYVWVVPWADSDVAPTGTYQLQIAPNVFSDSKAKTLAPYDQKTEIFLEPFINKARKLTQEVIAWSAEMSKVGFDTKNKALYEQAIRKNTFEIEMLEREMRGILSHQTYPQSWLARPVPVPAHWHGMQWR